MATAELECGRLKNLEVDKPHEKIWELEVGGLGLGRIAAGNHKGVAGSHGGQGGAEGLEWGAGRERVEGHRPDSEGF